MSEVVRRWLRRPRLTRNGALWLALSPCVAMGVLDAGRRISPGATPASDDFVVRVGHGLSEIGPLLALSIGAAVLVALVGSRLARRPMIPGAAVAGCLFALTLSPSTPLVPAVLSIVFGVFMAREIFGSVERSFVHPAVLGHVFLALAWPYALGDAAAWLPPEGVPEAGGLSAWFVLGPPVGAIGAASTLACLLGAAALVAKRVIPWRVVIAVPLGVALAMALLERAGQISAPPVPLSGHFLVGSLTFGAVFVAGLPDGAARTSSGQWFQGALIGVLVVTFRLTIPASPDAVMSAILVASIFAPLADHVVARGRRPTGEVRVG